MILSCLLLLLPQGTLWVDGLREGEQFHSLVSSHGVSPADECVGRIVDATSGVPVAGARVETWTEEISAPGQGYRLIGQALSGEDGCFRVGWRADGVEAEKVLVRAAGYLTFPGTLADLDLVHLMPDLGWGMELRILDPMDQPIEGAHITSTYSCPHDVPALDVRSDGGGLAQLGSFGLQDHMGQLRVSADGFAAVKYLDPWEVLGAAQRGKPFTLRLARQSRLHARMLTAQGQPLAHRLLVVHEDGGDHVARTDGRGVFAVASRYDSAAVQVDLLDEAGREFVFRGALPPQREVTLRQGGETWPADLPQGTLSVTLPTSLDGIAPVPVSVFHEDGWWINSLGAEGHTFPAGQVTVLVGEAFSPWEEQVLEFDLAEEQNLWIQPRRAPRLKILAPPGLRTIMVQARERSIEIKGAQQQTITVPRGEDLVILGRGTPPRRLQLKGLDSDGVADLRSAACVLPAPLIAPPSPRTLRVHVTGDGSGRLVARGANAPEVLDLGGGAFEVSHSGDSALLLGYRADGFQECWTAIRGDQLQLTLNPVRLASLTLDNQTGLELNLESIDAEALTSLHPGPLHLVFALGDGRRGVISMQLAPGERRSLSICAAP